MYLTLTKQEGPAKDVHRLARLGVRLEGSQDDGVIVHHNSESYLVVEVKSKQHLD